MKNKTVFFPYIKSSYDQYKLGYFKLNPLTTILFYNKSIARYYSKLCRVMIRKYKIRCINDDEGWKVIENQHNSHCYYYGFFQSDIYFKEYEKKIKDSFEIKNKFKLSFFNQYGEYFSNHRIISLHFRRTDYSIVEFPGLSKINVCLPISYYMKALSQIDNIDEYEIFVIGDDISYPQDKLPKLNNIHYVHNSPIVDFQIIQHSDIAIISNSTFAWWAAYLSKVYNPKVFAPKYWLGHQIKKTFPVGIECKHFEWIEF